MTDATPGRRTDTMSRIIRATPAALYRALTEARALAAWRPPKGMTGRMEAFDARPGGRYRMALTYKDPGHATPAKSDDHTDIVEGRFVELVPDARVVERVTFVSEDPAFAGEMTITTTLEALEGGTEVTFTCTNVPPGISREDHEAGISSSLENLAAFVEGD